MTTTAVPTKEMGSITINESDNQTPPKGNIHVESFCVKGPDLTQFGGGDGSNKTIVGTVTFFNKSAMVWLGWGDLEEGEISNESSENDTITTTGKGAPVMGPMVVAMPRSKYVGLGSNDESPCSQLIGGPNDEEMMMGWQMANRLTRKVGWPVFVSSSLNKNDASVESVESMDGFGDDSAVLHAAALAEKKVGEILLKRKASS